MTDVGSQLTSWGPLLLVRRQLRCVVPQLLKDLLCLRELHLLPESLAKPAENGERRERRERERERGREGGEWMSKWVSEWVSEQVGERLDGVSEWTSEQGVSK